MKKYETMKHITILKGKDLTVEKQQLLMYYLCYYKNLIRALSHERHRP